MLILTQDRDHIKAMVETHNAVFEQSQRLRIQAIAALKEAGDTLIKVRGLFRQALREGASPVETDLGVFETFDEFLKSGVCGFKKTAAYDYIKLAENWDIVLKLGMQDTSTSQTVNKSNRLVRTLLIIDWYKEQLTAGRPEEELTLERYWIENTNPPGPTRKELTEQVSNLVYALELERTEKELLKKRVEDLEKQLQQLQQKPSLQARLQALKDRNAELFV